MKRRIISLMIAVFLILGMPLQALAAEYTAANMDDIHTAFSDNTADEVVVNLTDNIEWIGGVTANEGQSYTINGDGHTIDGYVQVMGQGDITMNTDIVGGGLGIFEGADITVGGSVSGDQGVYMEGGSLDVTGDMNVISVQVYGGAEMTVNGSVTASSGIDVDNSSAAITGDVDADMVHASNGELTVGGDVNSTTGFSSIDSTVTVGGDVTGDQISTSDSDVTIDGNVTVDSIYASNGTVIVNGDVSANDVSASEGADVIISGTVTGTGTGSGISASSDGSITVNDNITADYITASNNGSVDVAGDADVAYGITVSEGAVTVEGDVTGQYIGINNGTASIDGNVSISNNGEDYFGYIDVDNGGDLTVEGTIETENLWVNNSSELTAESIEADHISVSDNSKLTVEGNVSAVNGTTISENSTATIGGNITSENSNALQAIAGSTVTIGGDAIGGSDVFTPEEGIVVANGGVGVVADNSNVTVKGDVVGGSVIAPADATMNQGGIGVAAMGSAVVNIEGNVTGGDATEGKGIGGFGVYYDDYERPFTGSVTVDGTVTGGKGGPDGMDGPAYVSAGTGIIAPAPAEPAPAEPAPEEDEVPVAAPVVTVPLALGSDEVEIPVAVSNDEIIIETLEEAEIEALLESLKETVKEGSSDTVTIDVSSFKEVSSVRFPVDVLKAIIEAFGKLEIVFNGGKLVIDAAEFEKLVAELGFVTIALK